MQLNSSEESTFVGPGSSGRQHEREVFLAGLARRPERATLMSNKGMRNPKDGLRPNESVVIIQAQIEAGKGLDAVCQRVAELYNKN